MYRVLAALRLFGPLTAADISAKAHVSKNTLSGGRYLETLKSRGFIHVTGWQKNGNGFTTPIYAAGRADDCPRPHFQPSDQDSRCMRRIVEVLEEFGPMSYREVAEVGGMSKNTIKNARYMDVLINQRKVHISDWRRSSSGPVTAIYMAGPGRNAAKPKPLSHAERVARWRIRSRVLDGSCSMLKTMIQLMPDL